MSKFSVKKPFTILVMVIAILILGGVSLSYMQMDLLPEMSLPYVLVITTYPGASPEKIETTISEPMESSLGTINGVKNIYSYSYENYGIVQMEFEDDTDIDSTMVKIYTSLDVVKEKFPDEVGTPNIMELSLDMMASQYLAVSYEGKDMEELSTFVENTVIPALERQSGVANVTSMGLIEQTIEVELDEKKVDDLNDKILALTNDKLDEALEDIEKGKQQLIDGQKEIDANRSKLASGQKEIDENKAKLASSKAGLEGQEAETYDKLASASEALDQLAYYQTQLLSQQANKTALETAVQKINEGLKPAKEGLDGLAKVKSAVDACLNADGTYNAAYGDADLGSGATGVQTAIGAISATGADTSGLVNAYAYYAATGDSSTLAAALKVSSDGLKAQMDQISPSIDQYSTTLNQYQTEIAALEVEIKVTESIISKYEEQLSAMGVTYKDIEVAKMKAASGFATGKAQIALGETTISSMQSQLDSGKAQIESGQKQVDEGWEQYNDGIEQYEEQKTASLKKANADELLSLQTLAGIFYAQNFSMPAGYIDDENDNSWMLKIGENFDSVEEFENMVLCHIDDIGDVKVKDVANVTVIDNSATTYTKLNNERAVILSVFKASTTGTNDMSKAAKAEIDRLEKEYDGLDIMIMMDQGDYITIIVNSVFQSMIIGAILAVVVLAIFLKDFKPTFVVAISIPLSVLVSLVLMYFTGISLNMMSLSGMALGIGMLVDNSIVVIENIYRLRSRGVPAPKAAVQGTKQVAGAITASTLTTACVFLPMVYSSGYVRQLMLPMALTIIFTLMASLFIAMTVVPASGSTVLKNTKPKNHPFFDKVQDIYGKMLEFCLRVKAVPLLVAVLLLALCIWQIIRMGIVMIPEMTTNQIQANAVFDEEMDREEIYSQMDWLVSGIANIDGVDKVGVMSGDSTAILSTVEKDDYVNYTMMITTTNQKAGSEEIKSIQKQMEDIASQTSANFSVSNGMDEMSQLLGSGLSVTILGDDLDTLLEISDDIMEIVESVDGYIEISNGQEEADDNLHLIIDKNKAMSKGLTVAQIYQEIAKGMTTSATAITVNVNGREMDVEIVNDLDKITKDNLLDTTFEVQTKDEDGKTVTEDVPLKEFASLESSEGFSSIGRENQSRFITVTASVENGKNATLLTRELQPLIDEYAKNSLPDGYSIELGGEYDSVIAMIKQMILIMLMGLAFIYLFMVAQFQSLLSPFIILFTIPLAFTGGLMALWFTGENLSIISLMGFLVLMGTVVNNGIVFVDYANQLRIGGMDRWDALIATGKTRMRPILMTALTTILAESNLIFGDDMGSQMGKGMALVIAGGLAYATLMTLFIIPVIYDILFKKAPLNIDIGEENLDDVLDDAAEYMEEMRKKNL